MKYLILLIVLTTCYLSIHFYQAPTLVAAQEKTQEITLTTQPIHTTSRFETKLITQTDTIAKTVMVKDDPSQELDDDTVLSEGQDGVKTSVIKISYYLGSEYSKEVVSTEVTPPQDKIISHGTKIVWRILDTPDGPVSYWRKLRVWATQYDSRCPGCGDSTAIGLKQGKGIIAVDPSIIKLRSNLYIPGYGKAVAGDTGGAIKGNIIDLGFDDARTSGWSSHFVDVYLTN